MRAADAAGVLQVKIWLTGNSPMVWRRVLVPIALTLRELHGLIQDAMSWEGIHLFDFHLRAERYGSLEVATSSPDVMLAALRLRKGTRFIYEYDLISPGAMRSGSRTGLSHVSLRSRLLPCPAQR